MHVTYFTAEVADNGKPVFGATSTATTAASPAALDGKPIAQIAESDPTLIQARAMKQAQANLEGRRVRRQQQDEGPSGLFSWLLN